MNIELNITDTDGPLLARIQSGLRNRKGLHSRMAADGEKFLKQSGREIAATQHRTAERLGANPTRHLEESYQAIEGEGKDEQAELRMPRASRLRAAFGDYVLRPGSGKTYLTIPDHAAVYGRRVGEFAEGTFKFAYFGKNRLYAALLFAEDGLGWKKGDVAYWLRQEVAVHEDATLIRFDLLAAEVRDSVEGFIDDLRRGGAAPLA